MSGRKGEVDGVKWGRVRIERSGRTVLDRVALEDLRVGVFAPRLEGVKE